MRDSVVRCVELKVQMLLKLLLAFSHLGNTHLYLNNNHPSITEDVAPYSKAD